MSSLMLFMLKDYNTQDWTVQQRGQWKGGLSISLLSFPRKRESRRSNAEEENPQDLKGECTKKRGRPWGADRASERQVLPLLYFPVP